MIYLLPEHIVGKIAAGEVIERPASILKELFENSIDAKAQHIDIKIYQGGLHKICITDDGIGMNEDDLKICFKHHSTSKININKYSDLLNITTLGFRGEALSSIVSSAKVSIQSGQSIKESSFVWNNTSNDLRPSSPLKGTIVTVDDLFFKTPARLHFLKSPKIEKENLLLWFKRLSIAHPNISCVIKDEKKMLFNLKKTAWQNRIYDFYDAEFIENTLEINEPNITGYISKPSYPKRFESMVFINGRFIRNFALHKIIKNAYGDLAFSIPSFILFLNLSPSEFDINVHPIKTEVRFRDERKIYTLIQNAILKRITEKKIVFFNKTDSIPKTENKMEEKDIHHVNINLETKQSHAKALSTLYAPMTSSLNQGNEKLNISNISSYNPAVKLQPTVCKNESIKIIGQFFNRYVIAQNAKGLVIIDQHAVHERYVYEQMKQKKIASQQLITPIKIKIDEHEKNTLINHQKNLNELGLAFEIFDDKVHLIALPSILQNIPYSKWFYKIFQNVLALKEEIYKILAENSCHSSIRSGQKLSEQEMNQLIESMNHIPHECNHGRPNHIILSVKEIDTWFQR